jgi:hypothetical protein
MMPENSETGNWYEENSSSFTRPSLQKLGMKSLPRMNPCTLFKLLIAHYQNHYHLLSSKSKDAKNGGIH